MTYTLTNVTDGANDVLAQYHNENVTAINGLDVRATNLESGWLAGLGTWSYSSADAPTFVISINADVTGLIGVGDRIKLTQTTAKYFIVTAVGAYSGGATLVTVYGGTDYVLANAAITLPFYSRVKAPFGFPLDPGKWSVTASDSVDRTQATPTANTWYNLGTISISLPIGLWKVSYKLVQRAEYTGTTAHQRSTLSTANNSESDAEFTIANTVSGASGAPLYFSLYVTVYEKILSLAAKTTYYLNAMTTVAQNNIAHRGDLSPTKIKAVCAYL